MVVQVQHQPSSAETSKAVFLLQRMSVIFNIENDGAGGTPLCLKVGVVLNMVTSFTAQVET